MSNIARKGSHQGEGGKKTPTPSVFQNRFGEDLVMTVTWGVYIQLINHVANLTTGLPEIIPMFSKLLWGIAIRTCGDQVPQSRIRPGIPSIGLK